MPSDARTDSLPTDRLTLSGGCCQAEPPAGRTGAGNPDCLHDGSWSLSAGKSGRFAGLTKITDSARRREARTLPGRKREMTSYWELETPPRSSGAQWGRRASLPLGSEVLRAGGAIVEPVVHVGVYCRISNDPQGLRVGVERQRQDCMELAARRWPGCQVELFIDNDLSAANPDVDRPRWRKLLLAVRGGDIDQIVAYDQSRLTRQPAEWEQLLVVLARRSIPSVHTVREGERVVTEGEGRMMSRIIAAVDAEYVEVMRVRSRRAMRQLAVEGRPSGGRVFGYRPAVGPDGRKTREPIPAEAAAIHLAAEQILSGASLTSVARRFEADQIPNCKKGHRWDATHIRSIVTNPSVAGLRRNPAGQLIPAVWPAILEPTSWRRISAVLASPVVLIRSDGTAYRATRGRRQARRHLLTGGLAVCGECGAPLEAQVRTKTGPDGQALVTYTCGPRRGNVCVTIVGHRLEPVVIEAVFAVASHVSARRLLGGTDIGAAAALVDELASVEAELVHLASQWASGAIQHVEWHEARLGFARRSERLRDGLARHALGDLCDPADLRADWPAMSLAARRAVVFALLKRIEVHRSGQDPIDPERITLVWNPPLDRAATNVGLSRQLAASRAEIHNRVAPLHQTDVGRARG